MLTPWAGQNVRHDCFSAALPESGVYAVEHSREGTLVYSGTVKLWWQNENSDHNDVAAFGRREPSTPDAAGSYQFQVGDTLLFLLSPPPPPSPSSSPRHLRLTPPSPPRQPPPPPLPWMAPPLFLNSSSLMEAPAQIRLRWRPQALEAPLPPEASWEHHMTKVGLRIGGLLCAVLSLYCWCVAIVGCRRRKRAAQLEREAREAEQQVLAAISQ